MTFFTLDSALEARDKAKKFAVSSDIGTDSGKRKRKPKVTQELKTYSLKVKKKKTDVVTVNHETSDSSVEELDDLPPVPFIRFTPSIKRETIRNEPPIPRTSTPATSPVASNSSSHNGVEGDNEILVTRTIHVPQTGADKCCCSKGTEIFI